MPCFGGPSKGLANLIAIAEEAVQESDSSPTQSADQTLCPDCGWRISGSFTWCPQCGYRLTPYQCQYCQGTVPQAEETCPRCGAPVN